MTTALPSSHELERIGRTHSDASAEGVVQNCAGLGN